MKHVELTLDAGGREAEVHPMYDVLANAPFVDRATAMHWNYSGGELGIMHFVEGDAAAFRDVMASIPEVVDYELTAADDDAFYAYVRDATNEPLRELFDVVEDGPIVTIPPVEYEPDGSVSFSVFGPSAEIQAAVERVPDPIAVTVNEVGSLAAAPGLFESLLSDRQREAVDAALSLGYYEIPREASLEDVAAAMGCAPSTAAEHLRKAESKLLRSAFEDRTARRPR